MFTGLIEEIGIVKEVVELGDGKRFTIEAPITTSDIRVDDSIAVNGVCLTTISSHEHCFDVIAVQETLKKTTTGTLTVGSTVNLERAMRMGDRLGGHLVQGHVDITGRITEIFQNDQGWEVWFAFPAQFRKYINPVGSICIDGISLTIADIKDNTLKVAVIPHTLAVTTLGTATVGTHVNLEFDMLAKYLETIITYR